MRLCALDSLDLYYELDCFGVLATRCMACLGLSKTIDAPSLIMDGQHTHMHTYGWDASALEERATIHLLVLYRRIRLACHITA